MTRKRLDENAGKFIFGEESKLEIKGEPKKSKPASSEKSAKQNSELLDKLTLSESRKERPIRVSLDLTPEMHKKLTNLANHTGRKKSEILRILLEQAFQDINFD